jgi:hypothetical protein
MDGTERNVAVMLMQKALLTAKKRRAPSKNEAHAGILKVRLGRKTMFCHH